MNQIIDTLVDAYNSIANPPDSEPDDAGSDSDYSDNESELVDAYDDPEPVEPTACKCRNEPDCPLPEPPTVESTKAASPHVDDEEPPLAVRNWFKLRKDQLKFHESQILYHQARIDSIINDGYTCIFS